MLTINKLRKDGYIYIIYLKPIENMMNNFLLLYHKHVYFTYKLLIT